MARVLARVNSAIQRLLANFIARYGLDVTARNRLRRLAALARSLDLNVARRARSGVTQDVAAVNAVLVTTLLSAHFPAAVRGVVVVHGGISGFRAKAVVVIGNFLGDMLTRRASPPQTFNNRRRRLSPLLYALQVKDVEAILTVPYRIVDSHSLAAYHAFVRVLCELFR